MSSNEDRKHFYTCYGVPINDTCIVFIEHLCQCQSLCHSNFHINANNVRNHFIITLAFWVELHSECSYAYTVCRS